MIKDFEFKEIWPIPILFTTVDLPHEEISDYVRETLAKYNSYTSYHDKKFNEHMKLRLPWRIALENCMKNAAKTFAEKRKIDCPPFLDYWFSVYNEGDDHVLHSHPYALVAGTYYPYADENSTKIRYRNPHGQLIAHSEPGERCDDMLYTHYPTTGELNCWPCWLEHEVRPQKDVDPDKSRIAISFNYGNLKRSIDKNEASR